MINEISAIIMSLVTIVIALYSLETKRSQRSIFAFSTFTVLLSIILLHAGILVLAITIFALGLGSILLLAALFTFSEEEKKKYDLNAVAVSILFFIVLALGLQVEPKIQESVALDPVIIPLIFIHGAFILALAIGLKIILREGEAK
ncbi:MAG: hypothetical protein J7L38_03945 [Thermoproteales archaeon]|nr:hypothetical protein [Thermoproteales archaeon]